MLALLGYESCDFSYFIWTAHGGEDFDIFNVRRNSAALLIAISLKGYGKINENLTLALPCIVECSYIKFFLNKKKNIKN